MITDIIQQFQRLRPRYEDLGRLLQESVTAMLENSGIAYDHITYRVKSEDSLREKIINRGYTSLGQCEDLCGVRIVLLYASDVDVVARTLAEQFKTSRVEDKRPGKAGRRHQFGYSSIHLIVSGPPPRLADLVAELQIRTIMQHGWAQIEHKLGYKGPARNYGQYARELYRLAALLELADQSFMNIRDALQLSKRPRKATVTKRQMAWVDEQPGAIQRDAAYDKGVLVWAQRNADERYRLRVQNRASGHVRWLSKEEGESLPRTDGRLVAAYRQGRGVVVYDLTRPQADPRLLTDGGYPGGLTADQVVVQGEGVTAGIETGISLVPMREDLPHRSLSSRGDSPRMDQHWVVWQEHFEGAYHLMGCKLAGHPVVLAYGASQPALCNGLVVWLEGGAAPGIRARDLLTGHVCPKIQAPAGFLDVRDFRISYLVNQGERNYDLVVYDLLAQTMVLQIPWVGLPLGRGPVLTDLDVVWEADHPKGGKNLRRARLPKSVWSTVMTTWNEAKAILDRRVTEHQSIFQNGGGLAWGGREAAPEEAGVMEIYLTTLEELLSGLQRRSFHRGGRLGKFSLRWLFHRVRREMGLHLMARFSTLPPGLEQAWEERTRMIKDRLLG